MLCKDCLLWQQCFEGIEYRQLETVPALAHIGFKDNRSLSTLYYGLDLEFRRLVSMMNTECPKSRCLLMILA